MRSRISGGDSDCVDTGRKLVSELYDCRQTKVNRWGDKLRLKLILKIRKIRMAVAGISMNNPEREILTESFPVRFLGAWAGSKSGCVVTGGPVHAEEPVFGGARSRAAREDSGEYILAFMTKKHYFLHLQCRD